MDLELTNEQKKRLAVITVSLLLIIFLVKFFLVGNGDERIYIPVATSSPLPSTSEKLYRLYDATTGVVPYFGDGTLHVKVQYAGGYVLSAVVYGDYYFMNFYSGSELQTVNSGPASSFFLDMNGLVTFEGKTVTATSTPLTVGEYTFDWGDGYIIAVWHGKYCYVTVTYFPVKTVFKKYKVWVSFETSSENGKGG